MPVKEKWAGFSRAKLRSFDTKATSQGEAQNSAIKSDNGVKANMSIANAAEAISRKTDFANHTKSLKVARQISTTPTWTTSETSMELTAYAEGLLHTQYMRGLNYVSVRMDETTWLVRYKGEMDDETQCDVNEEKEPSKKKTVPHSPIPKFQHLHIIKLVHSKYLTCSCNFFERHGLPCSHLLCIIGKPSLSSCSLRWWAKYDYYYLRHDDITKKLDRIREREEHYGLGPIFDELKPPDKYPVLNGADLDFFCLINGNNTYQIVEQVDVPFKIDKTSADALVRKEHPTKIVTCIDVNVDAIGCYEEAFNEDSVPDFPETYDGLGVITHLSVAAKAAKSATTANTGMTKSVSAYNEAMAVIKEITSFVENDEDKQKMMKRLLDVRDACMADKQANMANAMAKKNGGSSEKDLDTYVSSNFARDKRHNAKRLRTAGNI